ncbi:MAG: response regulator [Lachnospiraceae bacterium]|nr:response regulator [Lachnospiraceae bacterium]
MQKNNITRKLFESTHLMVLLSYTLFSVILIGETIIMKWELWAIPLILASNALSWIMHIGGSFPTRIRIWIYAILMMGTFFFYGIHETSAYDIAPVMCAVIILFTRIDDERLLSMCLCTYYITFGYDLIVMVNEGTVWTSLLVTRTLLHIFLVGVVWWVAKTLVKKWYSTLHQTDKEISELREATKRMDDFMVNISHEIRTPMNAVVGLSSVMVKEVKNKRQRDNLEKILDAGHRVSTQISDILDHTELDMGRLAVTDEVYMMSSVINDIITKVAPINNDRLELMFYVCPSVPASMYGDVDKIKKIIWHLVSNALKFTADGGVYVNIHAPRREYGVNLQIEVTDTGVGMDADEIEKVFDRFYQSDSGRTRAAGGLGLGLSIVQGFVRAMGGFLTIESELSVGTRVFVSIPQQVEDSTPSVVISNPDKVCVAGFIRFVTIPHPVVREYYNAMVTNLSEELKAPFRWVDSLEELKKLRTVYRLTHLIVGESEYVEYREYLDSIKDEVEILVFAKSTFELDADCGFKLLKKPLSTFSILNFGEGRELNKDENHIMCNGVRALVVDDEPMNIFVAKDILEEYGMIVASAESGMEAITMYEKEDYDIIFMDHMMPKMDGIEAMKRIKVIKKELNRETVIVALTANAVSAAKDMFITEGFDGFIPKPIEIPDFERVIKHVLPASLVQKNVNGERRPVREEDIIIEEKGRYEDLISIGVDTAVGLKYCRNDEQFYESLLSEYAKSHDTKKSAMEDAYKEEKWEEYAIHAHAIKSTSKMIGAAALSELARTLEEAGKAGRGQVIVDSHERFMADYDELTDVIKAITGMNEEEEADVIEFAPESDEVMEFAPTNDDVLEFAPEGNDDV